MARTEYRADLTEKHFLNVKCKSTSLLWFKPFSSSTQSMFLSPTNETLLDLSIAPNYLFLWHHCLHSHSLPCRPLYSRAKKSLPSPMCTSVPSCILLPCSTSLAVKPCSIRSLLWSLPYSQWISPALLLHLMHLLQMSHTTIPLRNILCR